MKKGFDRRTFLKGAAAAAATGGAALPAVAAALSAEEAGPAVLGPGPVNCVLLVNGARRELRLEPRTTLLEALHGPLGITGPKEVCDRGACGACAVLLDGTPVSSCMVLALDAEGRAVTTVEGLAAADGTPHPLSGAFLRNDALQCGFCTPGMVTACAGLLRRNPDPTPDEVRDAISGNLCRCGTYPRVVQACRDAAAAMKGGK